VSRKKRSRTGPCCSICERRLQAPRLIAAIHAASLRAGAAYGRESGQEKAEDPDVGSVEAFTNPTPVVADGMVARDQCDTRTL
jgi:hypothetical protein